MRRTLSILLLSSVGLWGCGQSTHVQAALPEKTIPPVPATVAMPVDSSLVAQARQELDAATKSADEVQRAHALEETKQVDLPDTPSIIVARLGDHSTLVRKAAALAAGELQVRSALDRLTQMIDSAKGGERIAVIFALHRLGDTSHSHELEDTSIDPAPGIRGDTALVLGMLSERSAVPILVSMLKDVEPGVRLQAAEALWKMGDQRGRDGLIDATVSADPDDRMIALLALAEPRDTRVLGHVEGLLTDDLPEVSLVAARAAGMLGSDRGYGLALQSAASPQANLRVLSGMAMGSIGRADSQPTLRKLLADTDPSVRLVAAGAILKIAKKA